MRGKRTLLMSVNAENICAMHTEWHFPSSQWAWALQFILNQPHIYSPVAVNTHCCTKCINSLLKTVPNKHTTYSVYFKKWNYIQYLWPVFTTSVGANELWVMCHRQRRKLESRYWDLLTEKKILSFQHCRLKSQGLRLMWSEWQTQACVCFYESRWVG